MKQAWREITQIAKWQFVGAVIGAMGVFGLFDWQQSLAFFVGSTVLITGVLISARIGLKKAGSPEASVLRVVAAIGWKWLWVLAGLVAAITKLNLPETGLVAGIITTQLLGLFAGMQNAVIK